MAQIAPTNSSLIIKAQVLPQDISKVSICHEKQVAVCRVGRVQLRIFTYPHSDYVTLKGAVRAISPDAITSESTGTTPDNPFYEVTIEPESSYLIRGKQQHLLKPGMNATADIISRQETVLSFLLREAKLLANVD